MIFVVTVTAVVSSAHNILCFTFLYLSAFLKLLWVNKCLLIFEVITL